LIFYQYFDDLAQETTSFHIYIIPCIVNNQFKTLNEKYYKILFLRYLYYNITLDIPTAFDSQGIIIIIIMEIKKQ